MNAGGPKPQKLPGAPKEVAVNDQATALARQKLKTSRTKGILATALAGETGGFGGQGGGGFGGNTALG